MSIRPLIYLILCTAYCFSGSCTTTDPDLNPKPSMPPTASRQLPWNTPVPGQGGGVMGALINEPRR